MINNNICKGCRRRGIDCDPDYLDTTCAVFDYLYGNGLIRQGQWIRHDTLLICSRCRHISDTTEDYCEHCGSFNRPILRQDIPLTSKGKM